MDTQHGIRTHRTTRGKTLTLMLAALTLLPLAACMIPSDGPGRVRRYSPEEERKWNEHLQAVEAQRLATESRANTALANPQAMSAIIAKVGTTGLSLEPWEEIALLRYCQQPGTIPVREVRKLFHYYDVHSNSYNVGGRNAVLMQQSVTEDDFLYLLTKANADRARSDDSLWMLLSNHPRTPPGMQRDMILQLVRDISVSPIRGREYRAVTNYFRDKNSIPSEYVPRLLEDLTRQSDWQRNEALRAFLAFHPLTADDLRLFLRHYSYTLSHSSIPAPPDTDPLAIIAGRPETPSDVLQGILQLNVSESTRKKVQERLQTFDKAKGAES